MASDTVSEAKAARRAEARQKARELAVQMGLRPQPVVAPIPVPPPLFVWMEGVGPVEPSGDHFGGIGAPLSCED